MSLREGITFLKQGFKQRSAVGALWPSSKALCRAMAEPVFADQPGPLRILEVGAGVGPVTREIVSRMRSGDHLDIVELNPAFCGELRGRFGGLVDIDVHEVSILDYQPPAAYNHIVSGLPLANFPSDMVEAIYHRYFDLLMPGGTFVMFQYHFGREALSMFGKGSDRRRIRRVMEYEKQLQGFEVQHEDILLNVPPARVRVRRRPPELTTTGHIHGKVSAAGA